MKLQDKDINIFIGWPKKPALGPPPRCSGCQGGVATNGAEAHRDPLRVSDRIPGARRLAMYKLYTGVGGWGK